MNNENNCNNCIHNIKCHTCIRNASSAGEENNWTDQDMNCIDAKKELSSKPIDTDKIQGCNHHNFTGNIQGCSHYTGDFTGFPKNSPGKEVTFSKHELILLKQLEEQSERYTESIEAYKECFERFIPDNKKDEATEFLLTYGCGLAKDMLKREK